MTGFSSFIHACPTFYLLILYLCLLCLLVEILVGRLRGGNAEGGASPPGIPPQPSHSQLPATVGHTPPYPSASSEHPSGVMMAPPQPHQGHHHLHTGDHLGNYGYPSPLAQSQLQQLPVHLQHQTVSLGFIPNSRGAQIISFPTASYATQPPPPFTHGLTAAPPSLFGGLPASFPTASHGVTYTSGPPPLEAHVKFLHAPSGVTIPPQPVPTYQLVPVGYQVLRPTIDNRLPSAPTPPTPANTASTKYSPPPLPTANQATSAGLAAISSSKRTGSFEQARDEQMGERDKFEEPLILSGKPYHYPVNIGKDVSNDVFSVLSTDADPTHPFLTHRLSRARGDGYVHA